MTMIAVTDLVRTAIQSYLDSGHKQSELAKILKLKSSGTIPMYLNGRIKSMSNVLFQVF